MKQSTAMGGCVRDSVQSPSTSHLEACRSGQEERASHPVHAPIPLFRHLEPAENFPVDALGTLKQTVLALHDIVQSPPAMCASSLLAPLMPKVSRIERLYSGVCGRMRVYG